MDGFAAPFGFIIILMYLIYRMWREIKLLAETKPVIASMSDVAASGGYYMAMAANTIVAENLTLTGSIGVVTGDLIFVQLSLTPSPLLDCSCCCSKIHLGKTI